MQKRVTAIYPNLFPTLKTFFKNTFVIKETVDRYSYSLIQQFLACCWLLIFALLIPYATHAFLFASSIRTDQTIDFSNSMEQLFPALTLAFIFLILLGVPATTLHIRRFREVGLTLTSFVLLWILSWASKIGLLYLFAQTMYRLTMNEPIVFRLPLTLSLLLIILVVFIIGHLPANRFVRRSEKKISTLFFYPSPR